MAQALTDYVADTSVVIQHLVSDIHTSNAETLFDALGETVRLHVPEFCLLECANVLWKRVRFHGLPEDVAVGLLENLVALPLVIVPVSVLLKRGLRIGSKHQLAVYDAVYIALAETLGYALVSDDERQIAVAKAEGVALKSLTEFQP